MRYTEPTIITTRETVEWTKSYPDYPASLWSLQYRFRSNVSTGFNASGTADGDDFVVTIPGTTTDDVTVAGKFTWQAWVTEIADSTNKILVGSGFTNIRLGFDPAAVVALETRSKAKIMLDTIDAALLAFATSDVQEYELSTPAGSRRVKRSDKQHLMEQRRHWAKIVARENNAERAKTTGKFGRSVTVTFKD